VPIAWAKGTDRTQKPLLNLERCLL
jgi:hypothetical protein